MSKDHEERMRILDDLSEIGVESIRALAKRAETATLDELVELATEYARITETVCANIGFQHDLDKAHRRAIAAEAADGPAKARPLPAPTVRAPGRGRLN